MLHSVGRETILKVQLKKQSQLSGEQIGVNSFMKGAYDNKTAFWGTKKQSQSKPICRPSTGNSKS